MPWSSWDTNLDGVKKASNLHSKMNNLFNSKAPPIEGFEEIYICKCFLVKLDHKHSSNLPDLSKCKSIGETPPFVAYTRNPSMKIPYKNKPMAMATSNKAQKLTHIGGNSLDLHKISPNIPSTCSKCKHNHILLKVSHAKYTRERLGDLT